MRATLLFTFFSALLLTCAALMSACGGGHCTVGASSACACINGAMGAQVCQLDGTLSACSCGVGGGGGNTMVGPGDMTAPGGPSFLSFGTNVTTLKQNETVIFSAVVTHPEGLDHIAGGTLTDASGAIQYGAFGSGTQKGGYSIELSWGEINQSEPINFASSDQRAFVAQFFDTDGRRSTKSITLTLSCDGKAACNGVCTDVTSDINNCGSCGNVCPTAQKCNAGVCGAPPMPGIKIVTTPQSCDSVCAQSNLTCDSTGAGCKAQLMGYPAAALYGSGSTTAPDAVPLTCSQVPASSNVNSSTMMTDAFTEEACCCK
jgi:hypothetical protein